MGTTPAYANSVLMGAALLTATETDLQIPTQALLIVTAGANGCKIEEVVVQASKSTLIGTTVAGLVYLFIYNGTTYWLYAVIPISAVTASATVAPYRISTTFNNLFIPASSFLYAAQSEASNNSVLNVLAFGGNY